MNGTGGKNLFDRKQNLGFAILRVVNKLDIKTLYMIMHTNYFRLMDHKNQLLSILIW